MCPFLTLSIIKYGSRVSSRDSVCAGAFTKDSIIYHIYPTPPLGQDITQGQFLSGV